MRDFVLIVQKAAILGFIILFLVAGIKFMVAFFAPGIAQSEVNVSNSQGPLMLVGLSLISAFFLFIFHHAYSEERPWAIQLSLLLGIALLVAGVIAAYSVTVAVFNLNEPDTRSLAVTFAGIPLAIIFIIGGLIRS